MCFDPYLLKDPANQLSTEVPNMQQKARKIALPGAVNNTGSRVVIDPTRQMR